MNRKAVFLTIDAMFAFVLTFLFLGFIFINMTFSSQEALTKDAMHDSLQYALLSAHKSGVLATLNNDTYQEFLNTTLSFCGNLSVSNTADTIIAIAGAVKGACTQATYPIVGRRTFYSGSTLYIAYLEVWYE
jgi:hypothetical protein